MRFNNKGAALVVIIIAMTIMAVLGTAIYRLTTTASYSELLANNNDQAYRLAIAGVRYCATNRSCAVTPTLYLPDTNHIITIAMSGSNVLTSTGIVNPGTFMEARRVIVSDMFPIWGTTTPPTGVISSTGDMPSFGDPSTIGSSSSMSSDQATQTINMGGNVTNGAGSLWYTGSSSAANCTAGSCSFNIGMRAYFDFVFKNEDYSTGSTTYGDGFTFAIISAITNTLGRTGGAPAGYSMGELLGYAGPGNTTDQLGLKPPKIAIEFDSYPNSNGDVCNSGSRNDNPSDSTFKNHAALIFWGDDLLAGNCLSIYPKKTFDDNRHGAGSGTDPVNSSNPDPTGFTDTASSGYYQNSGLKYQCKSSVNNCNWMEDGYTYSFRLEITRPTAPTGTIYNYVFKVWIYRLDIAPLSADQRTRYQNVISAYTDTAPHINKTVSFTAAQHANLEKIFFGFTVATGVATQQTTVSNMKFFFPTL